MDDILLLSVPPAVEPVTLAQGKVQAHVETADEDASIAALITASRAYVEETTGRALVTQTWTWQHISWTTLFRGAWNRVSRNAWGSKVVVPRPPLRSVVSITYLDASNAPHTLPATEYVVTPGDPGTIEPSSTFSWPEIASAGFPITITFTAGYGAPTETLTVSSVTYVDGNGDPQVIPPADYTVTAGAVAFATPPVVPFTVHFALVYGTVTAVPAPLTQAMLLLIKDWYDERGTIITGSRAQVAALPHAVETLLNLYRWSL
jgi:uncharacterized phiE125 gp8 family phage protein